MLFLPLDLDAKFQQGKFFFISALQYYHAALHPFLEQGLECYTTAYHILKNNLDNGTPPSSSRPALRCLVIQDCFERFIVSRMQHTPPLEDFTIRMCLALHICFLRLVLWRMHRLQSVKRLAKAT